MKMLRINGRVSRIFLPGRRTGGAEFPLNTSRRANRVMRATGGLNSRYDGFVILSTLSLPPHYEGREASYKLPGWWCVLKLKKPVPLTHHLRFLFMYGKVL